MRTSPGLSVVLLFLFFCFTGCVSMQPPRELATNPQPAYPFWAEFLRRTGSVKLRMLIDEAGRVEDVQVLGVEGHASFEDAVLEVVPHWRFEPARHDGRPVRASAIKTVRFELEKPGHVGSAGAEAPASDETIPLQSHGHGTDEGAVGADAPRQMRESRR